MPHHSWPKGSRIRCTDTGGYDAHLTEGKEYIFNYAEDDYVNIINDMGYSDGYLACRFELVQENPNPALPTTDNGLFVGQRVRCIQPFSGLTKDRMYMVFDIYKEHDKWFVRVRADPGYTSSFWASRFEPWFKPDALTPLPTNPSNGDTNMLVKMTFVTDHKFNFIGELCVVAGCGLKEAKDAVEAGIIFNLTDFQHVRHFSRVVDMIDQTFAHHQTAYKLETYTPVVRLADPVNTCDLFQQAPI